MHHARDADVLRSIRLVITRRKVGGRAECLIEEVDEYRASVNAGCAGWGLSGCDDDKGKEGEKERVEKA